MSRVLVSVCAACGWRGFPQRLWCPSCDADRLGEEEVRAGLVEDATVLRRSAGRELGGEVPLGTVLLDGGGRAIARLVEAASGDRVGVGFEDGTLVARPEERA
jgi:uncharacterized OB-fold protein